MANRLEGVMVIGKRSCSTSASLALAAVMLVSSNSRAGGTHDFTAEIRPFLDEHCAGCHNETLKKGGLDMNALTADLAKPPVFAVWVKVFDRLRVGEMPPKSVKKRPPQQQITQVLKALEMDLVAAERTRQERERRAVLRRLNRTEYENTLRDLFSLPDLRVRDLLPDDGRVNGYDKCGAGLELSYVQLEKYLEAADVVFTQAVASSESPPKSYRLRIYPYEQADFRNYVLEGDAICLKDQKYDDILFPPLSRRLPAAIKERERNNSTGYRGTIGIFREDAIVLHPKSPVFTAPHSGRYRISISLWSFHWNKGEVQPALKAEAACLKATNGRTLGYFDAPSLQPTVQTVEAWLSAGEKVQFSAASLWPVAVSELRGRVSQFVGPGIAVDWLDVEGPFHDQWPPKGHTQLFGDSLPSSARDPERDARPLLADFLRRAFRRPLAPDELDQYVSVVGRESTPSEDAANREKKGNWKYVIRTINGRQTAVKIYDSDKEIPFENAMLVAYKAALCSADFLFLKERPGQLDDWALASRLSYFFWNSMPDDELFALAERGRLNDPKVLRAQAERMLQDRRSERFVADFLDQWLDLRDIDATAPDHHLYPEASPYLRDSMLGESRAFFRELLEKDLPAVRIVDSDFAMLNQKMAEHYGMGGVSGTSFRKVSLPGGSHRGGFLTQASVLKVTADGTTTSPVRRGTWVLRKIVGQPPEPPPPGLTAVEPDVRGATSVRELLAKHRSQATCATCHAHIDPPGFALESFDVIGGWRERFRSLGQGDRPRRRNFPHYAYVRYRLAGPVDATGETFAGQRFASIDEFKAILLEDERQIARNLVGQLLTYATGAPPGFADRVEVEAILERTTSVACGVRSLVLEVIGSPLFRMK